MRGSPRVGALPSTSDLELENGQVETKAGGRPQAPGQANVKDESEVKTLFWEQWGAMGSSQQGGRM